MARTITKTVYTFKEMIALHEQGKVSKKALERVRDWLREGQADHQWWDYHYELWNDALDQIGFTDADIRFSGFWSQDDGASFTASVDVERLIDFLATAIKAKQRINPIPNQGKLHGHDEDFRPWIVYKIGHKTSMVNPTFRRLLEVRDSLDCTVKRTGHRYAHENTCEFQGDFSAWDEYPRSQTIVEELFSAAESLRKDLCHAIYATLEEEYEQLVSDDSLSELSEANDYMFDERGQRDG